jgi:hypothetical protein
MNNLNMERIITAKWLERYIDKTSEYDIKDWYLALSIRKHIHDYLVALYDNPLGFMSPLGHQNFKTPAIDRRLKFLTRPTWKAFIDAIEKECNAIICFRREYQTPDKYISHPAPSDFPFTTLSADTPDGNFVKVRVFMPDRYYRKYILPSVEIFEFLNLFNNEIYAEWQKQNINEQEIPEQLSLLSRKIESGEILNFSEDERRNISPPKESDFSVWSQTITKPSHAVKTVTTEYAFLYLDTQMQLSENDEGKNDNPFSKKMLWTEGYREKTILAEIDLMRSDREIKEDFNEWLKQIRLISDISAPPRKQTAKNPVQIMTDKLTRTLALAYIDFKIIELNYLEKEPESNFFDIIDTAYKDEDKERIKHVVRKAMSASFIKELSVQATHPSA